MVFAFRHLRRRAWGLLFAGLVVAATTVWFTSPYLRARIGDIPIEYQEYQQNIPASTGRRLVYWQKSLRFFADAPLFGNGTGSTRHLFEPARGRETGLGARVIQNTRNKAPRPP